MNPFQGRVILKSLKIIEKDIVPDSSAGGSVPEIECFALSKKKTLMRDIQMSPGCLGKVPVWPHQIHNGSVGDTL